jgi:hypothetical protein
MQDIIEIIKNLQTISGNNSAFKVLKDFERVLDELNIYVFKNWEEGELSEGPYVNRYDVTCKFMWKKHEMPDPKGGKRLAEYGCRVVYHKDHILMPRKIKDPDDFRPGTRKGKIDAHPVWIVEITIPKKLMQDIQVGKENQENYKMAELMKYTTTQVTADTQPQEVATDEQQS